MGKPRILVVEDERLVAMDIRNAVNQSGYDVVGIAASGEEAVRLAEEFRPDVALMDIVLEGQGDGVKAAAYLRSELDIPVVYLTAYEDEQTFQRAKQTAPFGYIVKPFRGMQLRNQIELALHRHELEVSLRRTNEELEQRVREVTSLNILFQQHLKERDQTEEGHHELETAVEQFLSDLTKMKDDLQQRLRSQSLEGMAEVGHLELSPVGIRRVGSSSTK